MPDNESKRTCYDYGDALIFPDMVDLYVHAPQYAFRGMCMDLEYAEGRLKKGATTSACIFATRHRYPQSLNLAERMERAVYLGLDEKSIAAKYAAGEKILT